MRWINRRQQISLLVGLWLILGLTGPGALGQETKTFVAYSMKVAQAQVQEAERRGEDFRRTQPDLFSLGGIAKPWAVTIDRRPSAECLKAGLQKACPDATRQC